MTQKSYLKKIVYALLTLVSFATSALNIIPYPQQISEQSGTLLLSDSIYFNSKADSTNNLFAHAMFNKAGTTLDTNTKSVEFQITLATNFTDTSSAVYKLEITGTKILLSAKNNLGVFYGLQTLRQLLPAKIENSSHSGKVELPLLKITDFPSYSWRGSMLDPARRFLSVEYLKNHIDRMALYKMNRLHLHLTDDQGWRIEIKSRPKLTEVGSTSQVQIGVGSINEISYQPFFYSQKEIKDLVLYAAERQVQIIPEIDMPGHINAALASYPMLGCAETEKWPFTGTQVGFSSFCLTEADKLDSVKVFVKDVLNEIVEIFPAPWIHIGADEAHVTEKIDYNDFVVWLDKEVRSRNRVTIGWSEVLTASIQPGAIVQEWQRNSSIENRAVNKKAFIIHSKCNTLYIDHANGTGDNNSMTWCSGPVTLEKIYATPLLSPSISLGAEAPLWGERVKDSLFADSKLWPRLIALSELTWSDSKPGYEDFGKRLSFHGARLDLMGIHYWEGGLVSWQHETKSPQASSVLANLKTVDPLIILPLNLPNANSISQRKPTKSFDVLGNSINSLKLNASGSYFRNESNQRIIHLNE